MNESWTAERVAAADDRLFAGIDSPAFDLWLVGLNALAAAEGCEDYSGQTGRDCWLRPFNDGLTPAEAWADEKSAGAHDVE